MSAEDVQPVARVLTHSNAVANETSHVNDDGVTLNDFVLDDPSPTETFALNKYCNNLLEVKELNDGSINYFMNVPEVIDPKDVARASFTVDEKKCMRNTRLEYL